MSKKPSGDDIRTELALIRTGLAAWGAALLLMQHHPYAWVVLFLLGAWSIFRARRSIV